MGEAVKRMVVAVGRKLPRRCLSAKRLEFSAWDKAARARGLTFSEWVRWLANRAVSP